MLSLYFVPLGFIISGTVHNVAILFALFLLSGLGMAGVGMGIMHDALHGSYSKNRRVNKFMGYAMNLIGANANVWKIQHNVLHHTYTNIEEADDDINAPFFLRFSPHAKWNKLHRFQHFYVWIFYGLSTISWVISKDFIRINRFRKLGFFKRKGEFNLEIVKICCWKLLYYSFALVLPLIMVPVAPWIVLLGFLAMHFITGLSITIIFQTAHIMPSTEFPLPDENGNMSDEWLAHQLATTTNYSPKSKLFSWLIGGLNYQVEHHLLPNICHVHYKKLSKIVADTAKEFNLPYHCKRTFVGAVLDHIKMLRSLGRLELAQVSTNENKVM
ncbi:acyl-CoA desaturase [Fulvivirga sp. M361]|uniref:fatty acid desaturase family protein n=1 Tax=Fulvivirga sp. M361 TaxID=2594266 RepID=UPI00117AC2BE|nr:acyl-CoA desaturase [Fulvivirga sp. M361]TRX59908.1 acyl-CoA desaturase [Fulvivirga sp. M361]